MGACPRMHRVSQRLSCSLLLSLPYGQLWVYHIDPFNILGGDLIYIVCM